MRQEHRYGLRLDQRNVLRCAGPRPRGAAVECATPIARPHEHELVVRCRNCGTEHAFRVQGNRLVWESPRTCHLPVVPPVP
jgi:RNase P subunit RPR2